MGIIYETDKHKAMNFIVWDRKIVWDDWLKHVESLPLDPDWRVVSRFLADVQTVSDTSTVMADAIERAAPLLGANREIISKKRGAVVATKRVKGTATSQHAHRAFSK